MKRLSHTAAVLAVLTLTSSTVQAQSNNFKAIQSFFPNSGTNNGNSLGSIQNGNSQPTSQWKVLPPARSNSSSLNRLTEQQQDTLRKMMESGVGGSRIGSLRDPQPGRIGNANGNGRANNNGMGAIQGGNQAPQRNGADDAAKIMNSVSGLIGAMNSRNNGWNNGQRYPNGTGYLPPSGAVLPAPQGRVAVPQGSIARRAPRNTLPVVTKKITILNPEANGADVSFLAEEEVVTLKSGYFSTLETRSKMTVNFDRGGEFGAARYSLTEGTYRFDVTEKGWELFKVKEDQPRVAAN